MLRREYKFCRHTWGCRHEVVYFTWLPVDSPKKYSNNEIDVMECLMLYMCTLLLTCYTVCHQSNRFLMESGCVLLREDTRWRHRRLPKYLERFLLVLLTFSTWYITNATIQCSDWLSILGQSNSSVKMLAESCICILPAIAQSFCRGSDKLAVFIKYKSHSC